MPTYKHPCPGCGTFIERDVVACPACGRQDPFAPARCPNCRTTVEAGWVACPKCGANLTPAASGDATPRAAPTTPSTPPAATAPPAVAARSCSGCGSPLPEGARFCRECGTLAAPA